MKSGFPPRLLHAAFTRLAVAALGIAGLALGASAIAASPEQVSMFRADLTHSGVYAGDGPATTPKIKWQFKTAGKIISSPALFKGRLYFGGNDAAFYAVDAASGAELWKFRNPGRNSSSPAVTDSTVYFGSYDDYFYALDRATGKPRWKFKTGGERRYAATHLHGNFPASERMPDPFDVYLSSPAMWNGTVYFGSGDGHIYALNAATGAVRWKYKTGDVVHSSPAIANGTLFIGGWDTYFYALDAKTGKLRWRLKTGDDPDIHNQIGVQSSPAVADGVVYFGCRDNHLYAVDARTGKKLWAVENDGSWVNTSPAVDGAKVYYATADTGTVHVLDAKTGAKLATNVLSPWYFFASPALTGKMLYIGSWDGFLYGLNRADLSVAWSFQTDASKANRGTFMRPNGKKKFRVEGSDDGNGFYDDLVRSVYGQFAMGTFLSSPIVADGVLYIGSTDGSLYALE